MNESNKPNELAQIVRFLDEIEALKSTTRTAWTATGRQESTAEHSWRLAMLCWCLADRWEKPVSLERALLLCLVHDLGERDTGDTSAALQPDAAEKEEAERRAIDRLAALLPGSRGDELRALWEEYSRAETPEARLVRMLDKAETLLQHTVGKNEPAIDHRFNLDYGRGYFPEAGDFAALRELLDARTRECIARDDEEGRTGP